EGAHPAEGVAEHHADPGAVPGPGLPARVLDGLPGGHDRQLHEPVQLPGLEAADQGVPVEPRHPAAEVRRAAPQLVVARRAGDAGPHPVPVLLDPDPGRGHQPESGDRDTERAPSGRHQGTAPLATTRLAASAMVIESVSSPYSIASPNSLSRTRVRSTITSESKLRSANVVSGPMDSCRTLKSSSRILAIRSSMEFIIALLTGRTWLLVRHRGRRGCRRAAVLWDTLARDALRDTRTRDALRDTRTRAPARRARPNPT